MASAPKKVKALLAYLALESGTPHPRGKLATLLWGASSEQQARQSLRQALVGLCVRRCRPMSFDLYHSETSRWRVDALDVDVFELDS